MFENGFVDSHVPGAARGTARGSNDETPSVHRRDIVPEFNIAKSFYGHDFITRSLDSF
jgi:hypothetical protein